MLSRRYVGNIGRDTYTVYSKLYCGISCTCALLAVVAEVGFNVCREGGAGERENKRNHRAIWLLLLLQGRFTPPPPPLPRPENFLLALPPSSSPAVWTRDQSNF